MRRAVLAGADTIEHGYGGTAEVFKADARPTASRCARRSRASEAYARYFEHWNGEEPAPESVQENRRSFQLAMKAGVPICMGGDVGVFTHGENWLEMEAMQRAGMPAAQVLIAATSGNARIFRLTDRGAGQARPARRPRRGRRRPDPRRLGGRHVRFVMKGGQIVRATLTDAPRLHPGGQPAHRRVPADASRAQRRSMPRRPPRSTPPTSRRSRDAGFEIIRLPDLPDDPDAVFVEDTALLLDGHAIITRPGAAVAGGRDRLHRRAASPAHFEVHRIDSGYLDGGDVLRIGQTLYVGLSTRTDERRHRRACERSAAPLGYDVVAGRAARLPAPQDRRDLRRADVPGSRSCSTIRAPSIRRNSRASSRSPVADEPAAANCLRAGDRLILPAGNPRTADALRDRGFHVVEVDVSELQKAEAGVTCMSLIDERP